jgi:1-acyl-sn-glycerol-3-phosphate acyltransferase
MYPEGTRSRDGRIGRVRSGAAVIAARHGVPIVPIYVSGTYDAMPPGQNWPRLRRSGLLRRRHRAEVRFGAAIAPRGEHARREVMDEVRAFWDRKGQPLEPVPEAHDVLLIHQALQAHEATLARRGARFQPVLPSLAEAELRRSSHAA